MGVSVIYQSFSPSKSFITAIDVKLRHVELQLQFKGKDGMESFKRK